jgi:hypothetical protein
MALSTAEAGRCFLHIELKEGTPVSIHWRCILRTNSQASRLKLYDGGIIGVYPNEAAARADAVAGQGVWEKPWGWETWIRRRSAAVSAGVEDRHVWAVYNEESHAINEAHDGFATPVGS